MGTGTTTGGYNNVAIGSTALEDHTSADSCVAIGSASLNNVTTGIRNIGIGTEAGTIVTTGADNIAIGTSANLTSSSASNQTVIGISATAQGDNSVTLGNASVTDVYMSQDSQAYVHSQNVPNHVANTMSSPYYRFDGVDDKIASTETFQTTFRNSFSISALVRFEDGQPSAKQTIFGLYDGTSGVESVQLLLLTNGTLRFIFTIDSNSATFTSSAVFGDGDTGWNHIVAVADESSDTIGIYLNGNSLGTTSTSSHVWTDYTSSQPPWIGARNLNGGWNEGMQGSIQNVKVWNKYLTATEVKEMYSGASVPFKYKGANQTNLISSAFQDTSGNEAFSGASSSGFTSTNSSGNGYVESVDEIALVAGKSYVLNYNAAITSGTYPNVIILQSSGGAHATVGSVVYTTVAGANSFVFTSTVTTNCVIRFYNEGSTNAGVVISGLTITKAGAVAEYDGSTAGALKWGDKSGNDLHGTVSGATLENTPYDSGTEYEEGTWTPRIGGTGGESGQAYSTQDGSYVRIGNIVHLQGQITLSTLGTITTQARIEDLPFTSNGTYDALLKIYHGGMSTGFSNLVGRIDQGSTSASLVGFDSSAANPTNITQSHLSATTSFRFSGTYQL
jgi:hypothetical protein